ncbi:hypothetical protein CBR_g29838 [Chara braunii]|uniref:Uncharacterized protein n=1 Tax=Chara braunii TaxID=69332 RepID=A0A388JWR4_CHABU|nr:hypothetical protein CBR_g29838 [Chara braunii]|eukprot:GBG62230.1 hypothetical protein CBR_g29838 [Chara braunii]
MVSKAGKETSSGASTPKVIGRAATFHDKYWALDWHLVIKVSYSGPVVFLRDSSGAYYPCGGVKNYAFDKLEVAEEYMRFHVTTCFDADGNEEPDNYKQVSLHLQKFIGYGMRAAAMPPFDKSRKKDGSQVVMLRPFDFLKRINCHKVSSHVCTVDNKLALSEPLIPFDIQLDEFASKLRSYKLQALGQAILHSAISVGSPHGGGDPGARQINSVGITERDKVVEKSESVQKSDLAPRWLTNMVSKRLSPGLKRWQGPTEVSSSRHDGGRGVGKDPEKTEDDLSAEQPVLERNAEGYEGYDEDEDDQFTVYDGGDSDEQGVGDGKEGVEDEDGGDDDDGGDDEKDGDDHRGLKDGDDDEGTGVRGAEDEDSYEAGSEGEEDEANEYGVSVNEPRKYADSQRLRSRDEDVLNTQRSVCSRKRKSRASDGGKEVADSGDEAVGVDPRDNMSKPEQLVSDAIDTTRGFFLEYDDDDNAIDQPVQVFVDVRKILPNPDNGEFQYNHRPLNEMLVASIKDAMERPEKQKEWDRNTFILAPVIEVTRNGQKQWQRLKPKDWRDEDVSSYHWYAVAGQHTVEAAKRLETTNSPSARKWGVWSWKARAVYFDDDHLDGYADIFTFDNTRETRSIPSSFRMVVTAIRGLWGHMKCPKGDWHLAKTKDDKVAQQQNYHAFLHKAIRMTPDTELWNQSLNNKFVRNWSNLLRPFMCLAPTGNAVWQLVNRFFDMWEKGELPGQDGVRPVDQEGRPREASGAGPAAKTVKRKKELVHYVQSNKSPNGEGRCHHRQEFRQETDNMNDLYTEVRRERYMVRMFKYVLFKSERRGQREWNDDFFIGYDDIMKRFEPHGLTKEKWEKKKMKLPVEITNNVPKRLGGVDEGKLGQGNVGGYKVMIEMYIECPYFIKLFLHEIVGAVSQLKDELQRVNANAQHILWDKGKCNTTYLPVCMAPLDGLQPTEDLTHAVKKLSCHLAVLDLAPHKNLDSWTEQRFANKGAGEQDISKKVNSVFEALLQNNLLEYCAAFYERKSSPSQGQIRWPLECRQTEQLYDSDILVGCTQAMEENIRNGSRQGAVKTSVAEKEGHERKDVECKKQGTHEASVDELLKMPFSEGVGAVPGEKTAGPGCGGEEAGNTKEQGEKEATTDEDAGDAGDGGAQRVPSGLGDPFSAANTGMSSHGGRSGGKHDAGDALVFGGASPRDTTEPFADNRDEGDKLLHMVCTSSGSQIAPDLMEREEGGGMEGVRMTHGREVENDDEEVDKDANLEHNMDVDSEDGLGKEASCRGRSGGSSSNVINLIEQSDLLSSACAQLLSRMRINFSAFPLDPATGKNSLEHGVLPQYV